MLFDNVAAVFAFDAVGADCAKCALIALSLRDRLRLRGRGSTDAICSFACARGSRKKHDFGTGRI